MPVFFFHLRTPAELQVDDVGLDCVDLEAAYLEACYAIPGLATDFIQRGCNPMEYGFEITDAAGAILHEVPFTELVRGHRRPRRLRVEALLPVSQAERAQTLIADLHHQIEKLRDGMKAARAWLDPSHAMPR